MLLKIIIMPLGVVKQHVRFILHPYAALGITLCSYLVYLVAK